MEALSLSRRCVSYSRHFGQVRYLGSWTRQGYTYHLWDPRYLRTPGVKIGHELQSSIQASNLEERDSGRNLVKPTILQTQDHSSPAQILRPPPSAGPFFNFVTGLLAKEGTPKNTHRRTMASSQTTVIATATAAAVATGLLGMDAPAETTIDALLC